MPPFTRPLFLSFPTLVIGNPSFCFLVLTREEQQKDGFPIKDVGNDGGGQRRVRIVSLS